MSMFTEALETILRDHCTPKVVRAIQAGGDATPLWNAIADAGFLELMASEEAGGAGLPLPELFGVVALLGRYAVPLPVAQGMAARAVLPQAPAGLVTIAPALHRTPAGWSAPNVPYGHIARHLLADDGDHLWLFDCAKARRTSAGLRDSATASLAFDETAAPERHARDGDALLAYGAAIHAALIAGAMEAAFDMTLQYGNDRVQFGKPLGKFQAIQHQLAVMAEQVVATRIAAEAAFQGAGRAPSLLPAAMAKARASEAVTTVASIAHAVHGAIGVTAEYDLQLFTRRLHEWRMAHGSEAHWHAVVGEAFAARPMTIVEFARSMAG
jgi:alkylation response protein AidB-like acyl-CoA dehydrogenase